MDVLPIDDLRRAFDSRDRSSPLVVASPTGSGKSTRIPLWAEKDGTVLVVEPRRVAARALACRVAEESGTRPGDLVGWAVRDDVVRSPSTRILFCTPGVALGMLGSGEMDAFSTWILDEFHERRADVDALLAACLSLGRSGRIVLLSATLDSASVADRIGGAVLEGGGRTHPVEIEHLASSSGAPEPDGLPLRLERALRLLDPCEGTVLVFLPGVPEILDAAAWLDGRVPGMILTLHGGLSLDEQSQVLSPDPSLRIVLSTNVAESALTVPDVVAVVDSGLERRIVRSGGFPRLELGAISQASADQRAGRAGRVRPGRCLRLWATHARLEARARPSIQVDDPQGWLLPVLLAGLDPRTLPWIDKPRADGLEDALERFSRLGLWEPDPWAPLGGNPTDLAREASVIPLPPDLAAFCLRLRGTSALRDGAALACALSAARPLFPGKASPDRMERRAAWAGGGGDLSLLARSLDLTEPQARSLGAHLPSWRDACRTGEKVCARLEITAGGWPREFQSDALARGLYELEPKALRRRRGAPGKEEYALGDGPGLVPSHQSLSLEPPPELALCVAAHGGADARGHKRVWMEAAEGLSASRALRLGLGRVEVMGSRQEDGRVWAQWRRRVGKEEIGREEGWALERDVWARAVLRCLDPATLEAVRTGLGLLALERCLRADAWVAPPETPEAWLLRRLERAQTPPRWPEIPKVPEPSDPKLLSRLFPSCWEGPGGIWRIEWDVWKGKVGWAAPAGIKTKAKPSIALRPGWR
jgi:ATP-dependent helicase HrpB